jgi:hypothetical protein
MTFMALLLLWIASRERFASCDGRAVGAAKCPRVRNEIGSRVDEGKPERSGGLLTPIHLYMQDDIKPDVSDRL